MLKNYGSNNNGCIKTMVAIIMKMLKNYGSNNNGCLKTMVAIIMDA